MFNKILRTIFIESGETTQAWADKIHTSRPNLSLFLHGKKMMLSDKIERIILQMDETQFERFLELTRQQYKSYKELLSNKAPESDSSESDADGLLPLANTNIVSSQTKDQPVS